MLDSILPSFSGTLACWAGFIGVLAAAITFLCLGFRNQWVAFSMAGSLLAGGAVMWASTPAWAQDPGALGAAARELIDQAEARGARPRRRFRAGPLRSRSGGRSIGRRPRPSPRRTVRTCSVG